MSRLAPYLGIIAALAIGVGIASFLGGSRLTVLQPFWKTDYSKLSVLPTESTPGPQLPNAPASSPPAPKETTIINPPAIKPPAVTATTPAQTPSAQSAPALPSTATQVPPSEPLLSSAATSLRGALVNIVCNVPAGTRLRSISASGVMIDPKGFILTNAHVAQYLLFDDMGVTCTIRTGTPARPAYKSKLVFIPPVWVSENAHALVEDAPTGTGEHDYAILAVSDSATKEPLPTLFPSVTLASVAPRLLAPVVIGSYGAQFLEANQIESALTPTLVYGSVKEIFTFGTSTIDVLALGGSAAAQEGSSGGGVMDLSGLLVGIITTSTVTGDTATRKLNAITASYIKSDYAAQSGQSLTTLLDMHPLVAANQFASHISSLESILKASLNN